MSTCSSLLTLINKTLKHRLITQSRCLRLTAIDTKLQESAFIGSSVTFKSLMSKACILLRSLFMMHDTMQHHSRGHLVRFCPDGRLNSFGYSRVRGSSLSKGKITEIIDLPCTQEAMRRTAQIGWLDTRLPSLSLVQNWLSLAEYVYRRRTAGCKYCYASQDESSSLKIGMTVLRHTELPLCYPQKNGSNGIEQHW